MSRTLLSVALSCVAALLGLLTAFLWNQNYARAAECDGIQRETERLRIENERLEMEVLEHELAPATLHEPGPDCARVAAGGGGGST